MTAKGKRIRLSGHAREQLLYRGTTELEVNQTIRRGEWGEAKLGRLQSELEFEFNAHWNEKFYTTKRVQPIFVEERDEIVVVTVYVYYF